MLTQCDFLVNSELGMATTMADLCRIHRQLIYNICTDSRSFTRIFNKTHVNYKLFFILTQKLASMSFHLRIWHLVELFFILWHCFLFVYLQIKRRDISKYKYQYWFNFFEISVGKSIIISRYIFFFLDNLYKIAKNVPYSEIRHTVPVPPITLSI